MGTPTLSRTFVLRDDNACKSLYGFLRANWTAMLGMGKPLVVTVTEWKAKRSTDQNKKLHALIRDLAAQAWVGGRQYDEDAWKEHIRRKFIGTEDVTLPDGTRIDRGISTTTLSVAECSDLIEQINQWAADELGVVLT